MIDCHWLSDQMPLVAQGRAEWTSEESRHLSTCSACQDEWDLVRLTNGLGEAVRVPNASAITRVVLQRLEQMRVARRRQKAWSFAGLAAAAALVAVLWSPRPVTRTGVPAGQPVVAGLLIPLPELDSMQSTELDSVLQTMDEPSADGSFLDAPSLGDLDSSELQSVLDYWEG